MSLAWGSGGPPTQDTELGHLAVQAVATWRAFGAAVPDVVETRSETETGLRGWSTTCARCCGKPQGAQQSQVPSFWTAAPRSQARL